MEEDSYLNEHRLWVNLSAHKKGNIFAILPEIMQKIYEDELFNNNNNNNNDEFFNIVLPSDNEWQSKIYNKLVEKQRMTDSTIKMTSLLNENEGKLHDWDIFPKSKQIKCNKASHESLEKCKKSMSGPKINWTVGDIAKAGCLLSVPVLPVTFDDEQEMRRVYTLIYDCFRYKYILSQALDEILFFQLYPELGDNQSLIWLLFYDLFYRSFRKRESKCLQLANELFEQCGLAFIEKALWDQRIKLAASVSRFRIQHRALSLSDLLPDHLKDEKVMVQANTNPITCWINIKKVGNLEDIVKDIQKMLKLKVTKNHPLNESNFLWDQHCPQTILFHYSLRPVLVQSKFVREYKLIIQDRSFCLGPATFAKLLTNLRLNGSVIQTHINSPRSTAYLANLLMQNDKINKLMAFNAGERLNEYKSYFNKLGLKNIVLYSDKLIDIFNDSTSKLMEEVVAVFATPPNSYSAINDPIDLICSRGGDLSMLEVLTESDTNQTGKKRVFEILEEQRKTLKLVMSRPEIQFVLYETHSELDIENNGMVRKSIEDINKLARLQHAILQGVVIPENFLDEEILSSIELNNNESISLNVNSFKKDDKNSNKKLSLSQLSRISDNIEDSFLRKIEIPETDVFDICKLPLLCPNEDFECLDVKSSGCFLALLKRKQVICLDHKYMIQMAENRGLFGKPSASNSKLKITKSKRKGEKNDHHGKKRSREIEIDRIAAPTHAFLCHISKSTEHFTCRCHLENTSESTYNYKKRSLIYRNWWKDTTHYITNLRKNLIDKKIIPPINKSGVNDETNTKTVINRFVYNTCKIDEILVKCNKTRNIPIIPKLRLQRDNYKIRNEKIPIPLAILDLPNDFNEPKYFY